MTLTWWRLEMDAPAELEESLLWKLQKIDDPLTITTAFRSDLDRFPIGGF